MVEELSGSDGEDELSALSQRYTKNIQLSFDTMNTKAEVFQLVYQRKYVGLNSTVNETLEGDEVQVSYRFICTQ